MLMTGDGLNHYQELEILIQFLSLKRKEKKKKKRHQQILNNLRKNLKKKKMMKAERKALEMNMVDFGIEVIERSLIEERLQEELDWVLKGPQVGRGVINGSTTR